MDNSNLTVEKLLKMWEFTIPPLYYATMENCKRGQVYTVEKTCDRPEYIVIHPLDYDELSQGITGRRLVHIRDYKPEHGRAYRKEQREK